MKTIYFTSILAIACALTSCDDSKKLAGQLQGTWTGAPEKLVDDHASTASYIPVYTFIKDNDKSGGTVMVNALITASGTTDGSNAIVTPYSLSASGRATLSGSWRATDDDDVALILDTNTLNVTVDPDAVIMTVNTIGETNQPAIDSLKPQIVNVLQMQMSQAIRNKLMTIKRIDDIKIRHDMMTCEINDTDYTFQRATNP